MSVIATPTGYTMRLDANASGFAFSGMQMIPSFVSDAPTYVVWVSGTTYRAANANTGLITHSGTDFRTIVHSICDGLCTSGVGHGGKLFFKEGTYLFPVNRVDLPSSDSLANGWASISGNVRIEFEGESRDKTIFKIAINNAHCIQTRVAEFVIRNMTLDGNDQSASLLLSSQAGVHVESHNCVYERAGNGNYLLSGQWGGFGIWLGNHATVSGGWASGVKSFIIKNNVFREMHSNFEDCCPTCQSGGFGIVDGNYFDRTGPDTLAILSGIGHSQLTGGCANNWIAVNNVFVRHSGNNLGITKEMNGDNRHVIIANNTLINSRILVGFSNPSDFSIRMRDINIHNNIIKGGNITVQGPDEDVGGNSINLITGISGWAQFIDDVKIHNNFVSESYFKGISIYRADGVLVKDNYLHNSNMVGNAITGPELGLILAQQYLDCTIEDNHLIMDDNRTAYGIRWISGTNMRLSNNYIKNTTTSGNASYIDGGISNINTMFVEAGERDIHRNTGMLNVLTATGTSNLGDGILASRFQSEASGSASFPTSTYQSGISVRTMTTGGSGGAPCGWRYNADLIRRDGYPKLTVQMNLGQTANTRMGIFFTSSASTVFLSGGSADPMSGRTGVGFWYDRGVSANIRSIRNSGTTGSTIADILGGQAADTGMHTYSVYGDNANAKWVLEYDYKRVEYSTITPNFNTSMGFHVYIENISGAAATANMAAIKLETN